MTNDSIRRTFPVSPSGSGTSDKKNYTAKETVLAWLSLLVGYLFCRTFFIWNRPFVGLLFTAVLFAFGIVFFGKTKRKARSWFYPVSALILSASFFFTGSELLRFLVFCYILLAFLMFCQTGGENALENHAGQLYLFEAFKAAFVSPFESFLACFRVIANKKGGKKAGKTLLLILAGAALTVFPTILVAALLSYDDNFNDILTKIYDVLWQDVAGRIWSLIFGIPVSMYVFGALCTSKIPKDDGFNGKICEKLEGSVKILPSIVGVVVLIPLIFLYAVFIIAQRGYYQDVFSGNLPPAHTYASFSHDGFFRLCAVAEINALVLIFLRIFTKKNAKGHISLTVRVSTVILSLFTLVLCATALSQMLMYVSVYGLTRLRLYTLWFIGLLALLFLVAILSQVIRKLPFAAICLTVFSLALGALTLPDTDALIATHNYNCYMAMEQEDGSESKLDMEYMETLGKSAIPTVARLADSSDEDVARAARLILGSYALRDYGYGFYDLNLPAIRAKIAYDRLPESIRNDCVRLAMENASDDEESVLESVESAP